MMEAKKFLKHIRSDIKETAEEYGKLLRPFFVMSAVYLLGISAILRANFNYIDDMGRAYHGGSGWSNFSRYLSDFLSVFIHADSYLTDVSPLTQILAVMMAAFAAVIALHVLTGKDRFTVWEYAAAVPLGLCPYFLECLSYKYDSPYMALSVLASVFPAMFHKRNRFLYTAAATLGALVVCMTYQAAAGIFPMLVVVMAIRRWNEGGDIRETAGFVAASACGYLAGMLFFKCILLQPVLEVYVEAGLLPLDRMIPDAVSHLKQYYVFVRYDFKKEWLVCIALLAAGFLARTVTGSVRKKPAALAVGAAGLCAVIVLAFGIYPVLQSPLYEPRSMYGFGALIAFLGICAVSGKGAGQTVIRLSALALAWAFFVFAFTYGNALFMQKTYTDFRITQVVGDLKDMEIFMSDHDKRVQISGSIGQAPALRNMPQDYQILNRLVPITFRDSIAWGWGRFGFSAYYGLDHMIWDTSQDLSALNLPVLKDTVYHTIKGNEDYVLIELK